MKRLLLAVLFSSAGAPAHAGPALESLERLASNEGRVMPPRRVALAAAPDEWQEVDTGLPPDPTGCARVVPPYTDARELNELLLDATVRRCRMLARVLVKRGANAAYVSGGRTALHVATVTGDAGMLIDFLSRGSRATPELLFAAIEAGKTDTAELLLFYGADPRPQRSGENSQLIHAARRGLDGTVAVMLYYKHLDPNEELIENGASTGVTMLHLLAWNGPARRPGFESAFNAAIQKGVFVQPAVPLTAAGRWAPYAGWTALDFALDAGGDDAVELLRRYNVRSGRN